VHEAKVTTAGTNSETKQMHHTGLGGQAWDTGAAMALYCAAHPSLFRECKKALELACGSGFAGIMSTVAAGAAFWGVGTDQEEDIAAQYFASLEEEEEQEKEPSQDFLSIEDIASSSTPPPKKSNQDDDVVGDAFPHHSRVPLPPVFKSLTMSDESEDVLQQTFVNCKNSQWEPEQLFLQELDWTQRALPKQFRSEFDVILACDVVYTFPDVKHASRAMAYALAPSPYDRTVGDKTHRGNAVLHIGPHNRDSIRELKQKLTQGYKMSVSVDRIKVRTTMLQTTILDSSEKEMTHEEEAGNGYIQYVPRSTQTTEYALLQAQHDEEYDGENGEWFFPAENGSEEQARFKRDIEPEAGFGNYGARASTNPKTGTW
jgi:predicted nicotinamide N-methyase